MIEIVQKGGRRTVFITPSLVKAIAYDRRDNTAKVRYTDGETIVYNDVDNISLENKG